MVFWWLLPISEQPLDLKNEQKGEKEEIIKKRKMITIKLVNNPSLINIWRRKNNDDQKKGEEMGMKKKVDHLLDEMRKLSRISVEAVHVRIGARRLQPDAGQRKERG